jgi:hypothetical protein
MNHYGNICKATEATLKSARAFCAQNNNVKEMAVRGSGTIHTAIEMWCVEAKPLEIALNRQISMFAFSAQKHH